MFFFLLVGHALADYPLQGEFLARWKNHWDSHVLYDWWILLTMHALIHGGAVALVTGSVALGIAETGAHALIDYAKCDGKIGFKMDQYLHVACKVVWLALLPAL